MRIASLIVVVVVLSLLLSGSGFTFSTAAPNTPTTTVQFFCFGGAQTSLTNERVHTDAYSVKLVIPSTADSGSGCMALYPYNGTLGSLSSFQVYTSFVNATPRFVILLDTNNDGKFDDVLLSDSQVCSTGFWQATQGGFRWGWSETNIELGTYGKSWNSLDYWKGIYGNASVLYVGVALEWGALSGSGGFDQPLYADEVVLNGVTHNVVPAANLTPLNPAAQDPTLSGQAMNVQLNTLGGGQAYLTSEHVRTGPYSVKLVMPGSSKPQSFAMALYPYNNSLNSLNSFYMWISYTTAVPRFMVVLDTNNDGLADLVLLSDYQFVSDGTWQAGMGGNRWGWSLSSLTLDNYGHPWSSFDYWKSQYGTSTVLSVGICLEYWAVYDRGGCDQPLFADGLVVNEVSYGLNITNPPPAPTPSPSPAPTPLPTTTPIPIPTQVPKNNLILSAAPSSPTMLAPILPLKPLTPLQKPLPISQPFATSPPTNYPQLHQLAVIPPERHDENQIVYWTISGSVLLIAMISVLMLTPVLKRKQ